jgi:hypothetical protein
MKLPLGKEHLIYVALAPPVNSSDFPIDVAGPAAILRRFSHQFESRDVQYSRR